MDINELGEETEGTATADGPAEPIKIFRFILPDGTEHQLSLSQADYMVAAMVFGLLTLGAFVSKDALVQELAASGFEQLVRIYRKMDPETLNSFDSFVKAFASSIPGRNRTKKKDDILAVLEELGIHIIVVR